MKSPKHVIPFCKPSINWRDKLAVLRVLDSGMLTEGTKVREFEKAFAEHVGAKYAIAVASGTDALFLALKAIGIKPGDNVAVPSLTFTASASVIDHCGANIIFADVKNRDFCIDWGEVGMLHWMKSLSAVISVDLTGNDSDITQEEKIKLGLGGVKTIIDSAHRIDKGCHKTGQLRTYSFHGTKNITTGFGGMVTTDDQDIAHFIRLGRMHGCFKKEWEGGVTSNARRYGYDVHFLGWKMNMNNIAAALGLSQLSRVGKILAKRKEKVELYNHVLNLDRSGLHLYPIFVEDRERFLHIMDDAGIECSIHFEPLHTLAAYKNVPLLRPLRNTDWLGKHIVSLPLFPDLPDEHILFIGDKVMKSCLLCENV